MTSFAALMALSATQTQQSEAQVQSQLADRKRREAQKRKELDERERKDREMEQKLRKKALEEAQRTKEREERYEAERRAKELALKRKEDEQRDALRYGPKKARTEYPSSSSAAREELRRRRMPESDDEAGGSALTREEKRRMRLQRELNYGASSFKRATGGYRKTGRRLAGGAVDVDATTASSSGANTSYRSVKERLAHEPPGLIRLNVNKRDTRTIDEILQDRAKAKSSKTLAGDDAKAFDDWFGKSKPKASSTAPPSSPSSIFSSRSPSPVQAARSEGSKAVSRASKSLSGTPPVISQSSAASKPALGGLSFSRNTATPASKGSGITVKSVGGKPAADKTSAHGAASSRPANGKFVTKGNAVSSRVASSSSAARPSFNGSKQVGSSAKLGGTAGSFKKRPRSPSYSPSPPPAKRRSAPPGGGGNSISTEIWKIFGKDRNAYVARDVYSDDEDMEAGARDLESEELYRLVLPRANLYA